MSLKIARELWDISLKTKTDILDKKHSEIVEKAKQLEFSDFCKNFRNWDKQSDSGIPFQFNLYNIKSYGFFKYFKFLLSKIKTFIFELFLVNNKFHLEYFLIAENNSLKEVELFNPNIKIRAFICVRYKRVRLIDNIALN